MDRYIFDWKRTLYNPESRQLIAGSIAVLQFLKGSGEQLSLVGKGSDDMHSEVARLGVRAFFDTVTFREGDKDEALFADLVDPVSPEKTVIIGDRARSEIAVGSSLGATTIWVRQGRFANEEPEYPAQQPSYTIYSLEELIPLIQSNQASFR